MIDLPLDPELAERSRAMFLLDARIAAARAELARLREAGVDGERRLVNRHDERLLRANERLVISAIEALESAAVATGLNQRDLLTGIPNRGLTLDRLETALAAARRNTRRVGVVFVDLDAFKSINDTRGHAAGDRALQAAAHRLTASVRGSDTVGRLGGDEFLAILPEIDGALDASRVVAKMGSAIGAPHDDADDAPPLSASIGVAIYPDDAATGAQLVELADQAMYRAKARGRGGVEFHDGRAAASLAEGAHETSPVAPLEAAEAARDADGQPVPAVPVDPAPHDQGERHRRTMQFLARVAHELRSPLAPIGAAVDLLEHLPAGDARLAQVPAILRRQLTHLTRLVDDLLDGARVAAGKFRLECVAVSLREILDPVIEAARLAIDERRQTLVLHLPAFPVRVHADPVRLAQVFGNLLDNASKYTPRGGEIGLALDCDGRSATLSVFDDGIGIEAQALPGIFELFVQESRARAHNGQGLGVGLSIVRELVEAHGGAISVASAGPGRGSCFVVTLPVLPGSAGVTPAAGSTAD
jgi:diguanylate cyclase (GGDEF)-like protein